ncbi:delta(14)-sterol reductase LBR isoform X2 [Neoarius graeffei]|uniref:delta(14)-sterol reductase LBR isoform X2 n=1 Tax=Neoarius graeffei TaxID=443677 RepID=UPI00298C86D2|nr:delta(14)-sterol reductase LBR isoform X2 [Neoarius graeffei]
MPVVRFQAGDTVMGRWPGSNLFYEVKVLSHSAKSELYTVIYKDGTELELKDADIKSMSGFRQGSSRARSRSRSRSRSPARTRRSRSRSPARTSRRSSSHTTETRREKLKDMLEVRLTPVTMPLVNSSNNEHEKKEENDTANKVVEEVKEETENQVSGRYNLRRRKDQGEERPLEQKKTQPIVSLATPQQTSKTTDLEFGGRIGPGPQSACRAGDRVVNGMPLKNGKTLKYRINGFYALLISGIAVGAGVYNGVDLVYIHTHFLQFYTSALLISILLSIYLFARSRWVSDDERAPAGNSGYAVYDFFMGRELNPRIKGFDIKFFCEMRPGLIGWLVFNFAMLHAEMKLQKLSTPSLAMLLVNGFQLLWVADGFWHEEKLLTKMNIVHDGFGFMLAFGDLAWVPFTLTCQSYYLASHPSDLSVFWIVAIILMNAIGYYIFRKANSQKFAFRRNPSDPTLSHLKTIPTATGKSLIASGLWGFVRHPNYLGNILIALAWSLTCGFNHLIPYFCLIYLIILLVHREARDEHQCRKKYGLAWDKYCKAVPYRIFPKVY